MVTILRSIYSFLISTILLSIIQFLTSFAPIIDTILLEVTNTYRLQILLKNSLTIAIIFLIVNSILFLVFWYYCTLFCIVYSSCQITWIKSGITSLIISLIVSVFICIFMAVFRKIGLKYHYQYIYNLSLFVSRLY